jgi:hypothetical protein
MGDLLAPQDMFDLGAADMRSPPQDTGSPRDMFEEPDLPNLADQAPDQPEMMTSPHVGTPCTVMGVAGTCREVADCTGELVATPGLCPGPASVQCCTPRQGVITPDGTCDPMVHVRPNEGRALEPAGLLGCPAGMTRVEGFCIDRWEAALIEQLGDGTQRTWSPYFNPGTAQVRAVSAPGLVPQGYINANQAQAACQRAGKRLCTSVEWLRACQGSPPTTYPYGASRQAGVCNDARARHPAVEYFGANDPNVFSKLGHPCINQLPASLLPTGERSGCISDDGLFDMMGNLHEWVADASGIFRGGFYVDTVRNGEGCLYRTTAHDRSHWDYSTGFRCCADP